MSEPTAARSLDRDPGLIARLWYVVREIAGLFKKAGVAWYDREPFQSGAVIAYYTVFSLPGLLVIAIAVAGSFVGTETVTSEVSREIGGAIGQQSAQDVKEIAAKARQSNSSIVSSIIGIATLLFGATGVFYHLQLILNRIWGVKAKPERAWLQVIRARLFSFGMVLTVGFLLLVSLIASALLAALADLLQARLSEAAAGLVLVGEFVISLGFVTLLFAAIFKFLPDAKIRWREVWVGALLTAILFAIAKALLGLWLANFDPDSAYGAAGTVILILLWVSYAALILLYGAEFTRAYADRVGHKIEPARGAIPIEQSSETG